VDGSNADQGVIENSMRKFIVIIATGLMLLASAVAASARFDGSASSQGSGQSQGATADKGAKGNNQSGTNSQNGQGNTPAKTTKPAVVAPKVTTPAVAAPTAPKDDQCGQQGEFSGQYEDPTTGCNAQSDTQSGAAEQTSKESDTTQTGSPSDQQGNNQD
jgi:hypothetical protein